MSQKREHMRRQIAGLGDRLDRLERLRMLDYQYHDQQLSNRAEQLSHRIDTERSLRKRSMERLREDVNALQGGRTVRDVLMILLAVMLVVALLTVRVGGEEVSKAPPPNPVAVLEQAEPQEASENQYIEQALLDRAMRIDNCTITYYCTERYAHICGTGNGITATGTQVSPGVSCAVDPDVIPLGSDVLVDYGDGELHYFVADDTGVRGNHVDLAVAGHQEALGLGVGTATVYWCENTL